MMTDNEDQLVKKFIHELECACQKRDPFVSVTSEYKAMSHTWEIDIHYGQRVEGYVLFKTARNNWDWFRHYRV